MRVTLAHRDEDGVRLAALLCEFGPGWRMISSAPLGGGIGPRRWVLNAQVVAHYSRMDPAAHLTEISPPGPGVGMLTAASVPAYTQATDHGVTALATVGLRIPTWAAAPVDGTDEDLRPGTINIIAVIPAALTDAALVNTVMTVTEAKTQALIESGYLGTGTASDAVCVAVRTDGPPEPFGGPRSTWGSRLARAVHQAMHEGITRWWSEAI
ncbi:adenosylcobinamide amidohydrolase [Acrocarpospora corrugata]|uniref:Adenosylcobinamide amidohydrolase n=1 Tax=Acrocarpospora corrugata TaxID=35763 RepID=A0A5M3WAW5_9ACTN|nr:adenosylcobinamide amidohydrolase [Acrocarpospora corrugata]GES03628.1 adenosylcobinamide amidohydrolase [Acrocarpospora corrugata]